MSKPPHYRGSYHVEARKVRQRAAADPTTECWRCGRTLDQHPAHRNGAPPRWTAGHLLDGVPGSPLAPEASTCNYSAGAKLGANRRHRGQRTELTW